MPFFVSTTYCVVSKRLTLVMTCDLYSVIFETSDTCEDGGCSKRNMVGSNKVDG